MELTTTITWLKRQDLASRIGATFQLNRACNSHCKERSSLKVCADSTKQQKTAECLFYSSKRRKQLLHFQQYIPDIVSNCSPVKITKNILNNSSDKQPEIPEFQRTEWCKHFLHGIPALRRGLSSQRVDYTIIALVNIVWRSVSQIPRKQLIYI